MSRNPAFVLACLIAWSAAGRAAEPRRIIFDEKQIEGKIRRPQLVLIKAEQRPTFTPMVMQSLAGNTSVVEFVSNAVIESSPYDGAFRFSDQRISNYAP
ncbi:MAG: hypothetical protein GF418_05815 [Chitinivibrionales bacterium]|nr:hypothetical protein [Chitinivibrionales bacterium]MBD3395127.1 hypothetical protein [Chitinivibrionales bacterium]